jgi:hypothetical protein
MRKASIIICCSIFLWIQYAFSQDSTSVTVWFLYGSKPAKGFEQVESKWFGGKHGGHVGIELDSGAIISFVPNGKFHWVAKNKNRHSRFVTHSPEAFSQIMGSVSAGKVKLCTVRIPLSLQQKVELDSIVAAYLATSPYDYAFVGMRCASAAYDLLARVGVMKKYPFWFLPWKIFYPKRIRTHLLKMGRKNHWKINSQEGGLSRKWEKDNV